MVGGGGGTLYDIFGVRCLFTNRTCFFRISRKKDSEREREGGGGVVRVFPRGRVLREIRRYDGMIEFFVF